MQKELSLGIVVGGRLEGTTLIEGFNLFIIAGELLKRTEMAFMKVK